MEEKCRKTAQPITTVSVDLNKIGLRKKNVYFSPSKKEN